MAFILGENVFPAYAGMFLRFYRREDDSWCFPRIRGDVPPPPVLPGLPAQFSPHTRGCSAPTTPMIAGAIVFPAYAGMFRRLLVKPSLGRSFPRIRGDVPSAWQANTARTLVFPAYAGMFRRSAPTVRQNSCFPRIRGDVPGRMQPLIFRSVFSPHTRGCSRGA